MKKTELDLPWEEKIEKETERPYGTVDSLYTWGLPHSISNCATLDELLHLSASFSSLHNKDL